MGIEVKEAGIEDRDSLLELYSQYHCEVRRRQGWSKESIEDRERVVDDILMRDKVFIAYDGAKPVGFIRIIEKDGTYWIEEVFVSPQYRGRGVGKKLVEAAERYIRRHDTAAYISVSPQDKGSLEFWVKMGYRTLNTIELVKDFIPTKRMNNTRLVELLGYTFKIAKWDEEEYDDVEKEYMELLEEFVKLGGSREEFLKIVNKSLREWIKYRKSGE